jgi:hypothetical protein
MEAVTIPEDVLEHLRSVAEDGPNTEGWFTSRQLQDGLAEAGTPMGINRVRNMLRKLMREGRLRQQRFSLTGPQAQVAGLLGASHTVMYRIEDA